MHPIAVAVVGALVFLVARFVFNRRQLPKGVKELPGPKGK